MNKMMTEVVTREAAEPELDIRAYFDVLRRRYLFLVIPAVVIAIAGAVVAQVLPKIYEARATILVESQAIPTEMASSTVTANAAERIQVIEQRLMTRDNLLEIARQFSLYQEGGNPPSPSVIVESMRGATSIEQIDVGRQLFRRDIGVIGFTVAFQYDNPTIAARVTNELVSSILAQNLETRLGRAAETSKFFESRLSLLEKDLLAMESKIADYKRENEAALPDTLAYRREQLAQLVEQISVIDRRMEIEENGEGDAVFAGDATEPATYRLQARELALESLKEQRDRLGALAEKGFVPQNRMTELDRQITTAELDILALKSEIAAAGGAGFGGLEAQKTFLQDKSQKVRDSIARTPTVEAELNVLNREYERLQSEYRQAQEKMNAATTGERLEEDRQAERFEVIEQATIPEKPVSPDRPKIMMAGMLGGLGIGAGLLILLELLDTSIRTTGDLERRLQLRPIATIPYVRTSEEQQKSRKTIFTLIAAMLIFGLVTAAAIHIFYQPLDLFLERVFNKLGL